MIIRYLQSIFCIICVYYFYDLTKFGFTNRSIIWSHKDMYNIIIRKTSKSLNIIEIMNEITNINRGLSDVYAIQPYSMKYPIVTMECLLPFCFYIYLLLSCRFLDVRGIYLKNPTSFQAPTPSEFINKICNRWTNPKNF